MGCHCFLQAFWSQFIIFDDKAVGEKFFQKTNSFRTFSKVLILLEGMQEKLQFHRGSYARQDSGPGYYVVGCGVLTFGVGELAKENKPETVVGRVWALTEVILAWPQQGDLTSGICLPLEELCPLQAPLESCVLLHGPPPATSLQQ